jgi:hypothetical protein
MTEKVFDGADYDHKRDSQRLSSQYLDIFNLMKDGTWRSLKEIEALTNHPEASISAQLRHARKDRFGSHIVNRKYIDNGLYVYQLIVKDSTPTKIELNRNGDKVVVPPTKGNISWLYATGILQILDDKYCKVIIKHQNKQGVWLGKLSEIQNLSAKEREDHGK